jgi:UDP:flavonoid glycosyltransferase YjiC (YdhE family)
MRVLFVTYGFSGHLKPMVALGWALRAAGHEVMVASHPYFTETITSSGLPALPAGPPFDLEGEVRKVAIPASWRTLRAATPAERRERWADLEVLRPAIHGAEVIAGDLVSFARSWPCDLVVYEPMGFAGPLVAKVLDIPAVRHLWTVDLTVPLQKFESVLFGDLMTPFGLDSLGVNGDLSLDPCPSRLQVDDGFPRQQMRYVPYNGPAVLPRWLREPAKRRRICISWGTSLTNNGLYQTFLAPLAVQAVADLDVEVVLAIADSQRSLFDDELPSNVIAAGPIGLDLLLPTCDALIHHGGGGTLMNAVVHGVPHLVVPYIPDCCCNAIQIVKTGAGVKVMGEDATVESLRSAVREVLEPRYREAARTLQAELEALPTPAETVPSLEKLSAV